MKKSSSESLVALFAALADPTRLRLVNLVRNGEICVCFFVEVLGEPQPKISRHLAFLRKNGIVDVRRDGKWVHYRLSENLHPDARLVIVGLSNVFDSDPIFVRDRASLDRACCSPRVSSTLERAPRPT